MPTLFLIVLIDLIGFGLVIPLLPFYAVRFGGTAPEVTWLLAAYSLTQLAAAPLWGRLSDRVGRRPVLMASMTASALAYLWLGLRRHAVDAVCGAGVGRRLRRQHRGGPSLYRRYHQAEERAHGMGHDRRRLWPRIYFRAGARRVPRRQRSGDGQSPSPRLARGRAVAHRPLRRSVRAAREPPARTARAGAAAGPGRPDPGRAAPPGPVAADRDLFSGHSRFRRDGEHLCAVGVAATRLGTGEGRLCLCLSRSAVGDHAGRADSSADQALRRGAAVAVRPGAARHRLWRSCRSPAI